MLRIIPQTLRLPILSSCYKKTAAASVQLQIRQAHAKRKKTPPPKHLTRYIPPRSIRRPPPSRRSSAPVVYTHTNLKVAIVGRPNVGKSTLFNRLAGAVRGRGNEGVANPSPLVFVRSVVDSVPGVTRDPREASGALSDLLLTVVDTPGLENAVGDSIPANVDVASGKEHVKLASASALCENPFYRQMYNQMEEKTVEAVAAADVVFFVIDASDGVTSIDKAISSWLHCSIKDTGKRVMVIANKCDVKDSEKRVTDAYELGFGDPMVLSAEQGFGFADLYAEMDRIQLEIRQETGQSTIQGYENPWNTDNSEEIKIHDPKKEEELSAFDDELVVAYRDRPGEEPLKQLVVSIAGRPNVGKSTLLNRLAGENRSLVGPEAGVTRDAVLCKWPVPDEWLAKRVKENHGRDAEVPPLWLVDTAGVRAQTKVLEEKLELLSVKTSLRALRHSHVVVMVLDACEPLVMQDAKIMDLVVTEGRATVLVVNKMDKLGITDKKELDEWKMQLRYIVDKRLSDVSGVEIVEMSAKKWEEDPDQMKRLFDAVCTAWSKWEKRIPTAHLNRFVQGFNERMAVGGGTKGTKRNRIGVTKFITQKKIRPPMFRLDGSSAVSLNYLRSLTNAIRLEFGFQGIPIRVKRPIRGRK